jgi:hypothetical protein
MYNILCPSSKKGGHIALLLSVGLSVSPPAFIFFTLVAHTEIKFGIKIYHKNIYVIYVLGMIDFLTELCRLDLDKFQ